MAKRITDFFGVSSKKQKPSNSESYILPQNVPAEASNSNTSLTINQVEGLIDCPSSSSEWYKGFKLDANWLIQTFEFLKKVKLGKRSVVHHQWYKGSKLDANWLIKTFEFLKKVKLGKRSGIQCILCFIQISQSKKLSRNGQVPIADGIRCDGKKELMRIVDYLK
ncbi:UDP-N-acetylenolpyruvoylglucosamine reductase, C-terminal [Cinara cedri]|uniref:UDP-N-acetylenolpyruvoylglucosamine reductase, C-terminal n=1 Tax=Cinara cedri TaxID=506608 RepID=A0A5E4MEW1_9HEMI|nr:UDP-N-acetylenolpyruvoylglucosamine reductase, C-terminal [Cinara cedri]